MSLDSEFKLRYRSLKQIKTFCGVSHDLRKIITNLKLLLKRNRGVRFTIFCLKQVSLLKVDSLFKFLNKLFSYYVVLFIINMFLFPIPSFPSLPVSTACFSLLALFSLLFILPFSLAAAKPMIFVKMKFWQGRISVMLTKEPHIFNKRSSTTELLTSVVSMFSAECFKL